MKILYVATVSNTINAFLIPHIKFLIEKGHQVDIACSINQELNDELIKLNVKVFSIPFSRKPYNLSNLKAYKSLKKVIAENGYEIIHSHTPIASFICRLITRRSKSIKRIYTAHGFHFYKGAPLLNWIIYYPIEKYLSKYTDVLITINKEDYERASKKMQAKKTVLINGVGIDFKKITQPLDIEQKKTELHILPSTFVILSVGELNNNKNQIAVLKALSTVKEFDFTYIICGEGKKRKFIEKSLVRYNLKEKVILMGHVSDIHVLYQFSDLFISSSKREGLPVSLIEALIIKIPIIASKIRGHKDLLAEEPSCQLYNPKKESNQLQMYIRYYYENNEIFRHYNQKIKKNNLSKYGIHNVLADLLNAYGFGD